MAETTKDALIAALLATYVLVDESTGRQYAVVAPSASWAHQRLLETTGAQPWDLVVLTQAACDSVLELAS